MLSFVRLLAIPSIVLLLSSCAHNWNETLSKSPKQKYEGTISAGAPFFVFIPAGSHKSLLPETISDSTYKEIYTYLDTQPSHKDYTSDSGNARSAHIVFIGHITTRYNELDQKKEDTFSISRVIRLSPVTADYLDWRTKY